MAPISNFGARVRQRLSKSCRSTSFQRHVPAAAQRRALLLSLNIAGLSPSLGALADPKTIVNSVLSAYGLPLLAKTKGFQVYDDFQQDFTLEYPRSWVLRANTQRAGVYISDFQTADKAVVEVLPVPVAESELVMQVVATAVSPGSAPTDKLTLPSERSVKVEQVELDGRRYTYLQFPSETLTNSGYYIKRRNFAVAACSGDKLIALVTSARSDQFNNDKAEVLTYIVRSFRVR